MARRMKLRLAYGEVLVYCERPVEDDGDAVQSAISGGFSLSDVHEVTS